MSSALLCVALLVTICQQAKQDATIASAYQQPNLQAEARPNPIIKYTLWLTVFTGLLALVSFGQGVLLYRAEGVTRDSADAAMLQAKAAVRVQGPFVEIRSFRAWHKTVDVVHGVPIGTEHLWGCDLVNFGKSPAFVTDIRYNAWIGNAPPVGPLYEHRGTPADPIVVPPDKSHPFTADDLVLSIDADAANQPGAIRDQYWAFVRIMYRDILGGVSEVGGIARYIDAIQYQPNFTVPGRFRMLDIPGYTFRTYRYPSPTEAEAPPLRQSGPGGGYTDR